MNISSLSINQLKSQIKSREFPLEIRNEAALNTLNSHFSKEKLLPLYIHGITGKGKTHLLQYHQKFQSSSGDHTFLTSFQIKEVHTIEGFCMAMRKQCRSFSFSNFDQAYLLYLAKKNPFLVTKDFNPSNFERNENLIETMDYLLPIVVDEIAGVSTPFRLAEHLVRKVIHHIKTPSEIKEILEALIEADLEVVENALISFISYDIEVGLNKSQGNLTLYIDALEVLDQIQTTDLLINPPFEWLQVLIQNLPMCKWIMAGRDPLNPKHWTTEVTQYEMPYPTENEVDAYLVTKNIQDTSVCQLIKKFSQNLPSVVTYCVDAFITCQSKSQSLDYLLSSKGYNQFVERTLMYLTDSERDALYVLIYFDYFDENQFEFAMKHFDTYFSTNNWNHFISRSFVNVIDEEAGIYKIDEIIRKALLNVYHQEASVSKITRQLDACRDAFDKTEDLDEKHLLFQIIASLYTLRVRAGDSSAIDIMAMWLGSRSASFLMVKDYEFLAKIYQKIHYETQYDGFAKYVAEYLIKSEVPQAAKPYLLIAESYLDKYFKNEPGIIFDSYSELASFYKSLGDYEKAVSLSLITLENLKLLGGDEAIDEYDTLSDLSSLYSLLGNHGLALKYAKEALELHKSLHMDDLKPMNDHSTIAEEHIVARLRSSVQKHNRLILNVFCATYHAGKPLDIKSMNEWLLEMKDKPESLEIQIHANDFLGHISENSGNDKAAEIYLNQNILLTKDFYGEFSTGHLESIEKLLKLYRKTCTYSAFTPLLKVYIKTLKSINLGYSYRSVKLFETTRLYLLEGDQKALQNEQAYVDHELLKRKRLLEKLYSKIHSVIQ